MQKPKSSSKLAPVMCALYDEMIVDETAAAVLRSEPNVELLPVTLVDHAGKKVPARHYFVNPLAKDCLVIDRCFPKWNHIDRESMSEQSAYAIDPRAPTARRCFASRDSAARRSSSRRSSARSSRSGSA